MEQQLTNTQENVLQQIINFVEKNGFPPTIREIMALMGYASVNNVQRILSVLEQRGYIKRNLRGGARCIEILKKAKANKNFEKRLPILGVISAGSPLLAEQNIEGYLTINPQIVGFDGDFVLRVNGDSMRDANIHHADLIVVKQTNYANNRDIIVALLDDETTVKRFYIEKDSVRLQPENPNYQPIIISKNDMYFKVLGKVQAVINKMASMGT